MKDLIKIPESVYDKIPDVFKAFKTTDVFVLTKIEGKTEATTNVPDGTSVKGKLNILETDGQPRVLVTGDGSPYSYLITSALVDVVDVIEDTVLFETVNSFYRLKKVKR